MVLGVTGSNGGWSCGGGRYRFRLIQPVQEEYRVSLLVARLTTLVLLRYTSAGATRENTCFRFIF